MRDNDLYTNIDIVTANDLTWHTLHIFYPHGWDDLVKMKNQRKTIYTCIYKTSPTRGVIKPKK